MLTRQATLRKEFDDATCGALVRGTMQADLSTDRSLRGRIQRRLEMAFSKVFLIRNFLDGDSARAAAMGVPFTRADRACALVAALIIFPKMWFYDWASRIGFLRQAADGRLIHKIERQLALYGHAEFETDPNTYKPAHA